MPSIAMMTYRPSAPSAARRPSPAARREAGPRSGVFSGHRLLVVFEIAVPFARDAQVFLHVGFAPRAEQGSHPLVGEALHQANREEVAHLPFECRSPFRDRLERSVA